MSMKNIVFWLGKKMLIMLLLITICIFPVFAFSPLQSESPYYTYTYNSKDDSIENQAGYRSIDILTNIDGAGQLNDPTDIYVTKNGEIYLLDSGNGRILELDKTFKLIKEIHVTDKDNKAINFKDATGLFVTNSGQILVADSKAPTVYIFSNDGAFIKTINAPNSDVLPAGFNYAPQRVLCDNFGVYYILSKGCYSGILQYSSDLDFIGFYGAENVSVSGKLLWDRFWKSIMTMAQASKLANYVPVEYTSLDIDNKGFVYAVKNDVDGSFKGQVKRLNPLGNNILAAKRFGDIVVTNAQQGSFASLFADVVYDDFGFINVLDKRRGRIYQYDTNANLLFAFGGLGTQKGTFTEPASIESINDKLLVTDRKANSITVFQRTAYGALYHQGVNLLNNGESNKSYDIWSEILKTDSMNQLANIGLGKALAYDGRYQDAMAYFKRANNRNSYSEAYKNYRSIELKNIFPIVMMALVILIAIPFLASAYRKRHPVNEYALTISKWRYPIYTMRHPFKGYTGLKEEKRSSMMLSNLIILGLFIVCIIMRQATGFLFNLNDLEAFNVFYVFFSSVGCFVFFVVSNWAVSMLMDGEGKLKEIWTFTAYALLPIVLFAIPITIISNFMTLDESAFYTLITYIMYAWAGIGIMMAVKEAHQFTMKQCIINLLLTLVGMVLVITLIAIVYSVVAQLIGFIVAIVTEVSLR